MGQARDDEDPGRPRVFRPGDVPAGANNAAARSARIVTPASTGSTRLYAGLFWSDPGATGGWSFQPDDPRLGEIVDGLPHLGDHDEVYLCLAGRLRLEWEDGSMDIAEGDVAYLPSGHTYRSRVLGEDQVRMFYVMSPPPGWMAPLDDAAGASVSSS